MHSAELMDRLRRRYPPPAFALFAEVGDQTGGRNRSADAIAMGLWRSRGIDLMGFEIKVDRRDWLREYKNPEKAEPIARFCDRWWIVVSDPEIVADGELPAGWGLIVPRGDGLAVSVDAPKLEPVPMTRLFLAALMRAKHKVNPLETAVREARDRGIEEGIARAKREWTVEVAHRKAEALRTSIEAFEEASGVKIDDWNGGHVGRAVAVVQSLFALDGRRQFQEMRRQAAQIVNEIDQALGATEPSEKAAE